jgi:putative oxidoreductase
MRDAHLLAGRLLLAAFFLVVCIQLIVDPGPLPERMTAMGFPFAGVLLPAASVLELVLALGIAVGVGVRPAAYILAGFCLLQIPMSHDFWNRSGVDGWWQLISAMQYVAMAGGLLVLAGAGPGRYSLRLG